MSGQRTLILADNAGAYCYPWATDRGVCVTAPAIAFERPAAAFHQFDKIIFINGADPEFVFHPVWRRERRPDSYFFLWDPARCPRFAPDAQTIADVKQFHKAYSFQREDCDDFDLNFNSTMYAPPPPGFLPRNPPRRYDVLFLGVPKDRLPLLRQLYEEMRGMGLRVFFRVGLMRGDETPPETRLGWMLTRRWMYYTDYLPFVTQSRALLDLYQSIQTGFSLRVMEHVFFGRKLITNNRVIRQADFYHPNNIFLLGEDDMAGLKDWLDLPFEPIPEEIKEYYTFEKWAERFH